MRVLGCLGFYGMYIKNLHVYCKPFYDLIRDDTVFEWKPEHEKLFCEIKNRLSSDTVLAIPNTKHPFHVHVDSSSIGTGSNLVQEFPEGKRIVSYNSRVFDKSEQKMSTTHRDLCGIVSALQTYEHYLLGSPHPIYIYCDHKPIIYLWGSLVQGSPKPPSRGKRHCLVVVDAFSRFLQVYPVASLGAEDTIKAF